MSELYRTDPNAAVRAKQLLELRAKSPMRKPVAQADVDGLALFDTVRSPGLF